MGGREGERRKKPIELWAEKLPGGRMCSTITNGDLEPVEAGTRREFADKVRAQVPGDQTVFVHFENAIRVINPGALRSIVQVWSHLREDLRASSRRCVEADWQGSPWPPDRQ